jgi:hypothetical protein
MYVHIGLSAAFGMPWEYFAEQEDDRVISTYLDLLKRRSGKGSRPAEPAVQWSG